ncbi:MAG: glucokinase [Halioglobus sp.]
MNKSVQIVADIGGTNARFAYVSADSDELLGVEILASADFPQFIDTIRHYIECAQLSHIDQICLAVAATVSQDWIGFGNNHWAFSCAELREALGIPVTVINDFHAQALSIDGLADNEFMWIGEPRPTKDSVKAVLGPGTGLGMSGLLSGGHIVPSEGGHIGFSPLDDHQQALHKILRQRYGRVSTERVLSGMGLSNLYWANSKLLGYDRELGPAEITAKAHTGDLCSVKTIDDFFAILAAVAGDVALMMGATGGVYISGGIVPRLLENFDAKTFRHRFEDKGRASDLCVIAPLAIVLAKQPGLRGCVAVLRR